ncbi:MAG TPA: sugar phosphate isomerase/epimerase [Gemmatimonadaceae bacterium]|jgi:sugar phosphate isomerase/epimerase|nr:sugar phosphate isomerase/epimerase [Gemmatimonadaceae bacterium]
MPYDRRSFLGVLGAAMLGRMVPASRAVTAALPPRAKLAEIGIQLYSVRRQAAADLPGTLSKLAAIGYKEVELAGYYDHSAAAFRDLLVKNGLAAPSGHIAIELIETQPESTFADAHTVGHEWITVPSLPRGSHETTDAWSQVASRFNSAASAAKLAGFRFAFHNHNDIVKRTGAVLPIDILMKETDPALVSFQMDISWAVDGGADPLALLARYPGRFKMLHVKDGLRPPNDTQTDVGAGAIDFKAIFAHARGIEHYFVESDSAADPLAFTAHSYTYLSNLEF